MKWRTKLVQVINEERGSMATGKLIDNTGINRERMVAGYQS